MLWTFQANRPVYLQIAERIIADISNSKLVSGAKLPDFRAFAYNIGANPNAVAKAYQYLVENQVLALVSGEYIVLESTQAEQAEEPEAKDVADDTNIKQKKLCSDFIREMSDLGLSKKEIVTFLCNYMVEENKNQNQ
ncbi:MAG: GntR family transcriptional regulator [Clostridiales bacterium]|jgi:DNA-binding transcriptional regulator YhcF (GntR family)|nr:GntR family transcriptional regulator [Clostridiales bacterium]